MFSPMSALLCDDSDSEESFSVGVYRTRDPVSNLRLRVRVSRLDDAKTVAAVDNDDDDDDDEEDEGGKRPHAAAAVDEVVIGWQEKLFSRRELRRLTAMREEDAASASALDRRFFRQAQAMAARDEVAVTMARTASVCTVIDGEIVRSDRRQAEEGEDDEDELTLPFVAMTTDPKEEASGLVQLMNDGLRRRRTNEAAAEANKQDIPTTDIVVNELTRDQRLRLHTTPQHVQLMLIRLDLSKADSHEDSEADYIDLCVIKYNANRVLEITPDFTRGKKPYKIEATVSETRTTFSLWLDHLSASMDMEQQLREAVATNAVLGRRATAALADVDPNDFETPDERTFRVVANVEIVSASDFEYDGLLVHYFVEMPLGWTATDPKQLYGMTCTSWTCPDPESGSDVAHFCHTFSVDVAFHINRLDSVNKETMPKWPQIFFEVISVDSWTRCRTEGYAFTSLPTHAGCYDLVLEAWRPDPSTPAAAMRRYFVGGTPELDDLAYAGCPGYVDGKVLSRYGFRTTSTGSLRVRLNAVHQSKAFLTETGRTTRRRYLLDRLSSATLFSSVSTVLEAFHKARSRIIRLTEAPDDNRHEE